MFGVSTFVGDGSSKARLIGGNIGSNTCLGINSSCDILIHCKKKRIKCYKHQLRVITRVPV